MKHPEETAWSDFVRGTLDAETSRSLKQHLEAGCSRCAAQVQALETVLGVARADLEAVVPEAALRSVRNLFRVQKLLAREAAAPRLVLTLAFDSLLAPEGASLRSAPAGDRHLVYESDEVTLDLQFETTPETGDGLLLGQVFDSEEAPVVGASAFLLLGDRVIAQDLTGRMGDFRLATAGSASHRLCLLMEGDRLINLELPSPGQSTGQV